MPMIKNSQLFSDCFAHPEPLADPFYHSEQLIIPASPESPDNAVITLWRNVRDRLTAAHVALGDKDNNSFANHVAELDKLLQQGNANFLEFTSFLPTLDVSYSSYRNLPDAERLDFLRTAARRFLEIRHPVYSAHGYSPVTVQVRRDFEKHKSGGSSARHKLDAIMQELGYQQANDLASFLKPRAYVHAEHAAYGECEAWLRDRGLAFQWQRNHQGKRPDIIIHKSGQVFITECKHLKETGGGQDKQLSELIDLISHDENALAKNRKVRISYVAFLDGVLFNALKAPRSKKMQAQRQAIEQHLKNTQRNYFVNTWGFRQLLA